MFNWKFVNKVILYDGSFDGLLSLVFDLYIRHEIPYKVIPESEYIFNMLDEIEVHQTNEIKAKRVYHGIVQNICYDALYQSYYAFLSGNTNNICENKEIEIIKYLLHGFQVGPSIHNMLSVDYVLKVHQLRKNVLGEAHRLKGLVRLQEIGDNLFYSTIHPDNHVLENIGNFLIKRFPTQNLILHDKNREIAFLYNTKEYTIIDVPKNAFTPTVTESEKEFQGLWKIFFQTIAIKERTNKRLQMQYMPKKYWKDLVEMSK